MASDRLYKRVQRAMAREIDTLDNGRLSIRESLIFAACQVAEGFEAIQAELDGRNVRHEFETLNIDGRVRFKSTLSTRDGQQVKVTLSGSALDKFRFDECTPSNTMLMMLAAGVLGLLEVTEQSRPVKVAASCPKCGTRLVSLVGGGHYCKRCRSGSGGAK